MTRYERLDGGDTTIAIAIHNAAAPRLLHFGSRLPPAIDLAGLDAATASLVRESTPDDPVHASLLPVAGAGFMGEPALAGASTEARGPIVWSTCSASVAGNTLVVSLHDARSRLRAVLHWRLDPETGVLSARTTVNNEGTATYHLDHLASFFLPLPGWATDIIAFSGDWSREAHASRFVAPPGAWVQANRTGRTGFAGATLLVAERTAHDLAGRVIAVHLAWSGDHCLSVETRSDGARHASVRAAFGRNEIAIAPGTSFETPVAYAAVTSDGFNGVSDVFHPFVRSNILPPQASTPRRVHFNSWEAVYFDFDIERLKELAGQACELGAERFVLDDGWFSGRLNDSAGLGDWTADPGRFPEGLDPLIAHVHRLGMDFGLWVEPEMISPDSALYRNHPDWCVHAPDAPRPTMRRQLWLDLSREDVRDHLFDVLDALLRTHEIAYLKWDCNRMRFPDLSQGDPVAYALVRGFYTLLDRLRAAHPRVEIESCASGGARIDLEVLRRACRVWPSDTTDAIERLRIQKWTGLLVPPEAMGAHVGPSPNPITGRRIDMAFRARVALFCHLGLELDPARLTDADRISLATHIALYKQYRPLLHSGRRLCWSGDDGTECRIAIAQDGAEALALLARTDVSVHATPAPVRLLGLDAGARYEVALPGPWPRLAARRFPDRSAWQAPRAFDGAVLAELGLRLPLSDPETAWLVHLRRL